MINRRHLHDRELVRRIYEDQPYPAEDNSILRKPAWRCIPVRWLGAHWKQAGRSPAPARVLIAGCGSGAEAFAMQRRFPKAEIVAIDFSPRSIDTARRIQAQDSKMRSIRFSVADLTNSRLHRTVGGDFDFISCHGVLSYITTPSGALANLARCLAADGALYLGVNGPRHTSVAGRQFLTGFGFDLLEFADNARMRSALELFDALSEPESPMRLAKMRSPYLASDLFGPLIHNLPLEEWLHLAQTEGLHFQGSFWALKAIRQVVQSDLTGSLLPRSRADVSRLVERARPAAFHQLVFTRNRILDPPWEDTAALLHWRPVWTFLYRGVLPDRQGSWKGMREVVLGSSTINTRLDWQMPAWEVEILRRSQSGRQSLGEILAKIPTRVPANLLREQLYILHQLVVLNFAPPAPWGARADHQSASIRPQK